MASKFLEMCRWGAKLARDFARDVPQDVGQDVGQFSRGVGSKQTMSQDEVAEFRAACRLRSEAIKLTLSAYEAGRVSAREDEALGVAPEGVRQISEAASDASVPPVE